MHLIFIHGSSLLIAKLMHIDQGSFGNPNTAWGFGLPIVYLAWICIVIALYFPCNWFMQVKQRRKDWWLSCLLRTKCRSRQTPVRFRPQYRGCRSRSLPPWSCRSSTDSWKTARKDCQADRMRYPLSLSQSCQWYLSRRWQHRASPASSHRGCAWSALPRLCHSRHTVPMRSRFFVLVKLYSCASSKLAIGA